MGSCSEGRDAGRDWLPAECHVLRVRRRWPGCEHPSPRTPIGAVKPIIFTTVGRSAPSRNLGLGALRATVGNTGLEGRDSGRDFLLRGECHVLRAGQVLARIVIDMHSLCFSTPVQDPSRVDLSCPRRKLSDLYRTPGVSISGLVKMRSPD